MNARIGRLRYLAYSFVCSVALLVASLVLMTIAGAGMRMVPAVQWLTVAAGAALAIVLGRRRLHDLGQTGWIALGLLIPIVNLAMYAWLLCAPGQPGANCFGPPPGPNSRSVRVLAWAVPVVFLLGVVAALVLAPHKSAAQRAHDEMEQAI